MDEFDIQTVSDSENPSPSDSSELNSLQLVPDPESENGWRVEKNPSVSLVPVEEVYTEEQLRSMNGVEYAALSEQLSFCSSSGRHLPGLPIGPLFEAAAAYPTLD